MGLEPTTSAVTGRRSNQLSHRAIYQALCPQNQILKNCFYPFAFSQKWQPLLSSKKSVRNDSLCCYFFSRYGSLYCSLRDSIRSDNLCWHFFKLNRLRFYYKMLTLLVVKPSTD